MTAITEPLNVFISSRMNELRAEREALLQLLPTLNYGNLSLRAWVFESAAPASSKSIRQVYLDALQNCSLYIGLFWNEYGQWTIDEFEQATTWGIERHIFVKDVDANRRDDRLKAFLDQYGDVRSGITAKWFRTTEELCSSVKQSIDTWIQERLMRRHAGDSAILAQDPDDISEKPRKLIGREKLLEELFLLLGEAHQVLLQGFGGMGKTAIAATLASNWIRQDHGAVLWLRAGSGDENAILEALVRGCDREQIQAIARLSADAKLKGVRQILRESGVTLVVLDDVWNGQALFHVLKAVPSDVALLVTSRQRFSLEKIREVGELSPHDALTLLSYYSDTDYTPGDSEPSALCRLLGYHAFAVQIAGKTLKTRRWSPAELREKIQESPYSLKTPADFNEKERASVKDLLDASLHALDEQERATFLAFGAFFAPTLSPELLGLYTGEASDIENRLLILQDNGLAECNKSGGPESRYYRIHDLAFSYAKAQSEMVQRSQALKACVVYAERHKEDFDALHLELDNLLGAAQAAWVKDEKESLIQIMLTLAVDGYMDNRGHTFPLLERLDEAIQAARQLGDGYRQTLHYLLGKRGNAYYERGALAAALRCYEEAGELAQALQQPERYILALCVASKVRSEMGDIEAASAGLERAHHLALESRDKNILAIVLENRTVHAYSQKQYDLARQFAKEEVELARRADDTEGSFFGLQNWAAAELGLRNFNESATLFEQALKVARAQGISNWIASALYGLGESVHELGRSSEAQHFLDEALHICQESGYSNKEKEIKEYMQQKNYAAQES